MYASSDLIDFDVLTFNLNSAIFGWKMNIAASLIYANLLFSQEHISQVW